MTDMLQEFLIESTEGVDLIDRHLVTLEASPEDPDLLTEIFRAMHTLKGGCGFYGFDNLERVAHSAENLLTLLRDGQLHFDAVVADALLGTVDVVRSILVTIEETEAEGDPAVDELTRRLDQLAIPAPPADEGPDATTEQDQPAPNSHEGEADPEAPLQPDSGDPQEPEEPETGDGPATRIGDILVESGAAERDDVELAATEQALGDTRPIGDILVDQGRAERDAVEEAMAGRQRPTGGPPSVADSTVRVDVGLLDQLVNLVGELVLSRNEIVNLAVEHDDHFFGPPSQRLNLITSELQERVMKTRMQPINSAWAKLPRVVRDLSHQLDKDITVEMTGQETELDRTIIEAIRDPLTHIVRNTVDHGIEGPDERMAAGKNRQGTLSLRASHEGEQVNIEISDDGRGIDPAIIRAKALERGLIDAKEADAMTDCEIVHLVFTPGFSTAESITNISGRGVGMDVVKSNVERIGGSIDLSTEPGQGTSFTIKIPLTLAIIPALTVRCGSNRYAIPQVNVVELVRLKHGDNDRIEDIHGAPVYRLRGRLLPIVDLRRELGMEPGQVRTTNIAVVKADGVRFGLVVDGIDDNGEIVVKPLSSQVRELKLFSGATILGDGRVALILDLLGLADQAGLNAGPANRPTGEAVEPTESTEPSSVGDSMIVLAVGQERLAVRLGQIDRLEEVRSDQVERSDGRPVVRYRDGLMPLIELGPVLGIGQSVLGERKRVNVVVCIHGGRTVGLVVDEILDIVHSTSVRATSADSTVVIDEMVTDLISPDEIIGRALPMLRPLETVTGSTPEPAPVAVPSVL